MKRFCLGAFLFFVILLVLAWCADITVTGALHKSKQQDYGVWNDLLTGNVDAEIVIHGSSRAWVQLDPTIFQQAFGKRTYNLGIDAFGFHMQYCRHMLLLERNRRPDYIVHVVDYSMFDMGERLYNVEQFLPYVNDPMIAEFTKAYRGLDEFERTVPFLRYVGRQRAIFHAAKILLQPERNIPDRTNGFGAQYLEWNGDLRAARAMYPNGIYENVNSGVVEIFREYLTQCSMLGIKIIFVYPPEYYEGQSLVVNRRKIMKMFEELATQYEIPYYDYSNHEISFHQEYFYNSQHLNAAGSRKFTSVLVADLAEEVR